jgi:hypothetical protein
MWQVVTETVYYYVLRKEFRYRDLTVPTGGRAEDTRAEENVVTFMYHLKPELLCDII